MYGVPDFYQNDNVKKGTGMQWRHQVVSDLPITVTVSGGSKRWTFSETMDIGGQSVVNRDFTVCIIRCVYRAELILHSVGR